MRDPFKEPASIFDIMKIWKRFPPQGTVSCFEYRPDKKRVFIVNQDDGSDDDMSDDSDDLEDSSGEPEEEEEESDD